MKQSSLSTTLVNKTRFYLVTVKASKVLSNSLSGFFFFIYPSIQDHVFLLNWGNFGGVFGGTFYKIIGGLLGIVIKTLGENPRVIFLH